MKTVAAKYQGYWNYYGLIGNSEGLKEFYWQATQLLFKWLNRRSQRPSYTWRALHRLLDRFGVPEPGLWSVPGNNWRSLAVGVGSWANYLPGLWSCDRPDSVSTSEWM
jgi:hypothetical protein